VANQLRDTLAFQASGIYYSNMNKQEMRGLMKGVLQGITDSDRAERSGRIARRLRETEAWNRADTVMCFLSMAHEIDTTEVIDAARAQGRRIAVPRIEGGDISFRLMPAEAGALARDRLGIPEPDPSWPTLEVPRAGRLFVVTPGLAFDRQGNRLGRGKGYYDRFLESARGEAESLTAVGICFSEQLLAEVPHTSRDQVVDGVVTEKESVSCGP
jgi:5-formyltetrahydrofolate cyclo-ligase